jgi:hypothetical protein
VLGDEASAAIAGVRLAGILADLLWTLISAPWYQRLNQLLSMLDYAQVRSCGKKLRDQWLEQEVRMYKLLESYREPEPFQLPLFSGSSPPPMPQIQEENWLYPSRLAGLRKTETESFSQIVKQSILEF